MKLLVVTFAMFLTSFATYGLGLEEVGKEIREASNQTITLKEQPKFQIDFKKNQRSQTYLPLKYIDFEKLNNLFHFDLDQFMQNYRSETFSEAKKKFYYEVNDANSERPYFFLSSWKSLNHPPIKKLKSSLEYYDAFFKQENHFKKDLKIFSPEFQRELDELTSTRLTFGNELQLLVSGSQSLPKKIELVNKSKKFFYSVVMVQYCDPETSPYVDALINKAREGVDVRLIVEQVWTSLILKKCVKKLRKGGVKVLFSRGFFNPKTLFSVLHDKFWISDGSEAVIGGQNMHAFENGSNSFNDHTLDKDVYVKGPAVTDLLKEFIKLWKLFDKTEEPDFSVAENIIITNLKLEQNNKLRGVDQYKAHLNDPVKRSKGVCRVLVQGDQTSRSLIGNAYLKIMNALEYSMVFNTPSLDLAEKNLNGEIIKAGHRAADRGVKIKILSNGQDGSFGEGGYQIRMLAKKMGKKGKHQLARRIFRFERRVARLQGNPVEKALRKFSKHDNVEAWMYFNHIHSKQIVFDRVLVSTGSYNFDPFSHRNHESTILCFDKLLVEQSEKQYVSEIVNSVPVQ